MGRRQNFNVIPLLSPKILLFPGQHIQSRAYPDAAAFSLSVEQLLLLKLSDPQNRESKEIVRRR